jgi:tetratricopeptide (TPR) repeat protein
VALVPVGMIVWHGADPISPSQAARRAAAFAWDCAWYGAWAAVLLLLYPPSLPFLRLRGRDLWRRLGTDRTPLYEGLARLRHLETHDDHLKVGRIALHLGELERAAEHLGRAHELDPSHLSGRFHLAMALTRTGRDEAAVDLLGSIVLADEKHAFGDALFHLGRIRYRRHQHAAAIEVLRRHQVLFPGHRAGALILARALAVTGATDAAVAALAVARRPVDHGAHLSLTEALARARARVTVLALHRRRPSHA